MKILIAPDKFKGVQTAREAARNIAAGIREVLPSAILEVVPVADGGEGTTDVMCDALGGAWQQCNAHDARDRSVAAGYVWLEERETAVMEISAVAGVQHWQAQRCDIDQATTFGIGEMMLAATERGAREIVVGLGGSVTNDGGFGMARALGFRFIDAAGAELKGPVSQLRKLSRIEKPPLASTRPQVIAAADVRNPLLGENGATNVFGPQKGASVSLLPLLEDALERLADIIAQEFGVDYRSTPGAGAAGGLAFGLMSFSGASIRPGFEVVSEAIGLESKIRGADIVVTGEGSLDRQTLEGKAPAEVARLGRRLGKRVFAVVGRTDGDARLQKLFDGIYAVADPSRSEEENISRAPELLRAGGRQLGRSLL